MRPDYFYRRMRNIAIVTYPKYRFRPHTTGYGSNVMVSGTYQGGYILAVTVGLVVIATGDN